MEPEKTKEEIEAEIAAALYVKIFHEYVVKPEQVESVWSSENPN